MSPLLLWQLADSAFPTGGFAHSGGLEAAVQLGVIRREDDLQAFIAEALWCSSSFALPYVAAAHADPSRLAELDLRFDAYTRSDVANRASRALGEAFLRAAAAAFGGRVDALATRVREERLACHLAPVHGAILSHLGASSADARRLFLFSQLRGLVSAAVRLGAIGPLAGQAMQARLAEVAEAAASWSEHVSLEDAAQTTPLIDLFQGHQDRLYSRLFRS